MAEKLGAARIATLAVAAALGVLTLYFGVPRTVAAFVLLPGDRPLQALQNGRVPPAQALANIVGTRTAGAHWIEQGQLYSDRALVRLVEAEQAAKGESPSKDKLEAVAGDLVRGLSLAPVNPHAWARLSYVRYLEKDLPGVASTLRMSFLTGPYEPEITFPRLRLALAAYSNFLTEERELTKRQIRFAWLLSRDEVVELALLSQRILVFRLALVNQPQDLAIFDAMLKERAS